MQKKKKTLILQMHADENADYPNFIPKPGACFYICLQLDKNYMQSLKAVGRIKETNNLLSLFPILNLTDQPKTSNLKAGGGVV
jgi:hypothetical protein